jgi:hypothetical protein
MTRLITHTTRVCSSSLTSHRTGRGLVLLQPSNEATTESLQARSLSLQGWGLIDLPLRASNEGSPRPRVARAQKIISLHPLLSCPVLSCPVLSWSKEPIPLSVLLLAYFTLRPSPESEDIILVLDPDQRTDDQRKDKKLLSLFVHDRHDRKTSEGCQCATG